LIGLNARAVFLREVATAGTNVLIMFGGESRARFYRLATYFFYKGYLSIRYTTRSGVYAEE